MVPTGSEYFKPAVLCLALSAEFRVPGVGWGGEGSGGGGRREGVVRGRVCVCVVGGGGRGGGTDALNTLFV